MFETFNSPGFYVTADAILALQATGRTSGIVVDVGDGVAHTTPIYEGYIIQKSVSSLVLAKRDLTDFLKIMLNRKVVSLSTADELDAVQAIKETTCYTALDFDAELQTATMGEDEKHYELPDGQVITIGSEGPPLQKRYSSHTCWSPRPKGCTGWPSIQLCDAPKTRGQN